jgi:predicted nucleotidyltransferase
MSAHTGEQRAQGIDDDAASGGTCLDSPYLAPHLEAIRELARAYGVRRLEVFGSVCTPRFDPQHSDIDFLVDYPPDYDFGLWLKRYFELKDRLAALLGHPVDRVMIGAPRNRYALQSINETRQILHAT